MRFPDLSGTKTFNFIVPIGSLEQHGPFAPFGTDTYITDYLVNEIEKKIPELIILPTLEFSRAQEHRGFFGTVYLTEETLAQVLFDICNSIYKKANYIFITSFHHNEPYIEKFIKEKSEFLHPAKIVILDMIDENDDKKIEKILGGPIDGHAGNSEISNMMVIDESTIIMPTIDDKKYVVDDAFKTDDMIEICPNGIADNHPDWIVNKEIGQKILDIYTERIIKNVEIYLK